MASLGAADAKQEQKRFKELPDAEAASRYNLSILYRRAAKPRGNGEPAKE